MVQEVMTSSYLSRPGQGLVQVLRLARSVVPEDLERKQEK
jgi:hypothetical protein